jgi:hypothetical protein
MLLLSIPETREGVRIGPDFKNLAAIGQDLSSLAFDPVYLMPPCIFIPRVLNYDLDRSPEDNNGQLSLGFYKQVTN